MNDAFWIKLLMKHADVIAKWANEEFELQNQVCDDGFKIGDDPINYLPKELQCILVDRSAFRLACRKGLIDRKRGVWISRFANKSVFSYFTGCCFSGDYVEDDVVKKGAHSYPASDLEKLFCTSNLRDSRKNMLDKQISKRCKSIDYLFVKTPK